MSGSRACTALTLLSFIASVTGKQDACPDLIAGREWEPLRIKVLLGATDAITSDQLAILTTELLPRAVAFWEKSMRVRRTGSPFRAHEKIHSPCGHTVITRTLLDLVDNGYTSGCLRCGPRPARERGDESPAASYVLIVTATAPHADAVTHIAYSCECAIDECGRPTVGHLQVNSVLLSGGFSEDAIISALVHEIAHTLGFRARFADWRFPDGTRRIQDPKSIRYFVRKDRRSGGEYRATFGRPLNPFARAYVHTYTMGIVESIAIRGFGDGSTCRCPTDPTKTYTDEDLADCFANRSNCAFAVTTPRVKAAVQEFFGCDDLEGMELENHHGGFPYILNPHWKPRLVNGEIMNPTLSLAPSYISPMTFAFFEDSGWYQMDYSMTSSLVKGATWGYKQGCAFAREKCVNDETGEVQRPPFFTNAFCAISDYQCSPDRRGDASCIRGMSPIVLPQYQYKNGIGGSHRFFDFCPVLVNTASDWSKFTDPPSTSARCLMGTRTSDYSGPDKPTPTHTTVRCIGATNSSRQSYEVTSSGRVRGVCADEGLAMIYPLNGGWSTEVLFCADPALICAQFRYPHLPASSKLNQQVDGVAQPNLPIDASPSIFHIAPIPTKPPPTPKRKRRLWRQLAGPAFTEIE